jgi:hypothetical protein
MAPQLVTISQDSSEIISLENSGGNMGTFIRSMEIIGPNANNFNILLGSLSNAFLVPGMIHDISVEYLGNIAGETATLVINYENSDQLNIDLESATLASSKMALQKEALNVEAHAVLYPNPASQNVNLQIMNTESESATIMLFTGMGQLIRTFNLKSLKVEKALYNLDVSGLPDGVYLINIKTNDGHNFGEQLVIKN